MEDDSGTGSAGRQSACKGYNDEAGPQVIGDGVADDLAGVQDDDGRGVDPAVDGFDVGDVTAPAQVGRWGGEVTSDQIRGVDGVLTCNGGPFLGFGVPFLQPGGFHQPPHRLRAVRIPRETNSAQTRRTPRWPCKSAWICSISLVSCTSARSRSLNPAAARHR